MKSIKVPLALMGFCFLSNGYAMDNNKKEQIVKDLSQANALLSTAEKSADAIDSFTKEKICVCANAGLSAELSPEDRMCVYKEKQNVIRLANQVYGLSENIVNDGSVSPRTQQEAEASRHRAYAILQKCGSKK